MFLWTSVSVFRLHSLFSNENSSSLEILSTVAKLLIPALAIVFGMAWWTIWRKKPSASIWGIAASACNILLSGIMLYYAPRVLWQVALALLVLGILGVVAFSSPRQIEAMNPKQVPHTSISGDGTNAFIDKFIWIPATAAFLGGCYWWWNWGRPLDLTPVNLIFFWLNFGMATSACIVVHELGHVAAAKSLGMKVRGLVLGPFQLQKRDGKWEFQFRLSIQGSTSIVPTNLRHWRLDQASTIAAGPIASLVLGLTASAVALSAPGTPWTHIWMFLALTSTLSLVTFILSLIPHKTKTGYSDGAYIYQTLSKGPWAEYHQIMNFVLSSLATPSRPRDYDIDAIQRSCAWMISGPRGMHLRLLASSYHMDQVDISEARKSLNEAESIYDDSVHDIPAELHTVFVFQKALLDRDSIGARLWWDRMEAKKPTRFNVDYWLARGALLWIENNRSEAREAWGKSQCSRAKAAKLRRI